MHAPAPRRHCWVTGPEDAPGPHAGIILEWAKRGEEWHGRVAYCVDSDGALVVQWLPADLLRPVV